jgi:chromosome segregation ATPase
VLSRTAFRLITLLLLTAAFPTSAFYLKAQDSQDAPSVAEAARRAREKKEAAAAKPTTVITNDSIPSAPVTEAAPAGNAPAAGAAAPEGSADAPADADAPSEKKDEVSALKKEIAEKEGSVSLLKRQLALEQDNFYSNPDHERDSAAKGKLDSMQADLKTQQDELAALKAKLTDAAQSDASKAPEQTNPPATSDKQ